VDNIKIVPFQRIDQEAVKTLILDGLVEHWGYLDEEKNPDLDDIADSYAHGIFMVAWLDGEIVGTGAFIPHSDIVVEIVRMSVLKELRMHGIGRKILGELCSRADQVGYKRVILETTRAWKDVIAFYLKLGFRMTHEYEDDIYFALDLPAGFINHVSHDPKNG
jgi:GNAT superfamily N-acetyltransferase